MSSELWLGVTFSIPVGLAINIATPYVAGWIEQRNKRSADKRAQRDARFKQRAEDFSKDKASLYVYLLETLIRAAYIGALFGVLSGTMFLLMQSSTAVLPFTNIYYRLINGAVGSAGQLFGLLGALIVLNITRAAVHMIREVRNVGSAGG